MFFLKYILKFIQNVRDEHFKMKQINENRGNSPTAPPIPLIAMALPNHLFFYIFVCDLFFIYLSDNVLIMYYKLYYSFLLFATHCVSVFPLILGFLIPC